MLKIWPFGFQVSHELFKKLGRVSLYGKGKPYDKMMQMHAIIECEVEHAILLISPWIERADYYKVLNVLSKCGVMIEDMWMINFSSVDIDSLDFEKSAVQSHTAYKIKSTIGLGLAIRKEGLKESINAIVEKILGICLKKFTNTKPEQYIKIIYGDKIPGPLQKDVCAPTSNFNTALTDLNIKDNVKDIQLRYLAILMGSDNLAGQLNISKGLNIIGNIKHEVDTLEIMGMTILRVEETNKLQKPIAEFVSSIKTALRSNDLFLVILRGRCIQKKLKEIYDSTKRKLFVLDVKRNSTISVPAFVITDGIAVDQLIDIYSHYRGKLYDDPLNRNSLMHALIEPYEKPMEELLFKSTPCQCNKLMADVCLNNKDALAFCVIKPYKSPTKLLTRTIKALGNVGLTLVDIFIGELKTEQVQMLYAFELPEDQGKNYDRYLAYMQSSHCYLLLFSGKDAIFKM